MKLSKRICTLSLFSLYIPASAQVNDTAKSQIKYPAAEYFQEKNFSLNSSLYTSLDTALEGVQKYFPGNFPFSLGLGGRNLSHPFDPKIGFRSGFNNLDFLGYNREDVKYYRVRAPFTEVFVLFGAKKEQYSKIIHTQNITKQWNIAVSMLRVRAEGFYQRQNCTDNNTSASTNYSSKNNRYSLLASGVISSIKSDENGGITNDSLFESNLTGNKKIIPVNLMDARTKRRHRDIYLKQSLYFGKKGKIMKGDSIIASRIQPTNSISYTFDANDNEFGYQENTLDSNYYENNFFDSTRTRDSTHTEEFIHGLSFQTVLLNRVKINLGAAHKKRRFVQYNPDTLRALDTNFLDQELDFEISNNAYKKKKKGFFWNVGVQRIFSGPHEGDEHYFSSLQLVFNKGNKILLDYLNAYHTVPFLFNSYNSNHFWWKNSFPKITDEKIKLAYIDPKHQFVLSASLMRITNYTYFDSTFSPTVHTGSDNISIYTFFLQKNFHLKHLGSNNRITWQQVSEDVIRLPQFVFIHSLYYTGRWFRKAVEVQVGFDITYYTEYFGDAYMPALGQFYLQDERKLGNYPFLNFFFNMQIKHASIFFKSEHINSGFSGSNYFLAPHMPGPDRSLKIGVRWMFYD